MDKIERLKGKAQVFVKNKTKAFIIDTYDNFYFCFITRVGEDYCYIENFEGNRKGKHEKLIWFDIDKITEYKKEGEGDGNGKNKIKGS